MNTARQEKPTTDERQDDVATTPAPASRQGAKGTAPRGRGTARARRNAAVEVARRLDPELSARLTQIILPVVRDFSATIMEAMRPSLQSYQDQLARLMVQQVETILPTIQNELEREAKARVAQALESMRIEKAALAPAPAGGSNGQEPDPQPQQRSEQLEESQARNRPSETNTQSQSKIPGGTEMAAKTAQSEQETEETTDENQDDKKNAQPQAKQSGQAADQAEGTDDTGGNDSAPRPANRSNSPARRQSQQPTYYYDPQAAARTGLLQLATAWKDTGSTYQAMHAYFEILNRYPQTGTAAAATEGLVDLATRLERQGMFYAALSIYQKLERAL